jgi:hypothetical protein
VRRKSPPPPGKSGLEGGEQQTGGDPVRAVVNATSKENNTMTFIRTSSEKNGKTKQPPVVEIRLGRVRAAIWENQKKDGGSDLSVTFGRLYKDDEDQWQDASSFRRDDLPALCEVAHTAWIKLYELKQKEKIADNEE